MLGRRVLWALPSLLLLVAAPAALAAAPAEVSAPIKLYEFGITPSGYEFLPGMQVTFDIENIGDIPHNLFVGEDGALAKWEPTLNKGEKATVTFTVPQEPPEGGRIVYYCAVAGHLELGMVGNLTIQGFAPAGAAAGEGPTVGEIRALGVDYYAYWVGVISFVVLFVVLAATFFLLRHGETRHWMDQRDRPAKEKGEAPRPTGTYVVLAVVLVIGIIAAMQAVRMG